MCSSDLQLQNGLAISRRANLIQFLDTQEIAVPVLTESVLFEFGKALLAGGGATQEEATIVGRSLVDANLRGHDSHGVIRTPGYVNLASTGVLKPGARADIAVSDPATFGERGTTFEPNLLATGMKHVVVNGVLTLADSKLTGHRGGEVLRRKGQPITF